MTENPEPDPGAWSATPPGPEWQSATPPGPEWQSAKPSGPEWQSATPPPSYDPSQHGTPQYGQQAYPGQSHAPPPGPSAAPYGQQPYPAPGYPPAAGYSVPGFAGVADPWAPYGRDPATGTPLSDKSKVSAGLLQLFLGGFGAGRFYLGHNGIAIGQLATLFIGWILFIVIGLGIFILLGLGIWVLVDAIMMFSGGVRDSRGLVLRP